MTYAATCPSCSRRIALSYDEADATPLYCPFCGEEIGDDTISDYDDAPGIKGADGEDNWDDDDGR